MPRNPELIAFYKTFAVPGLYLCPKGLHSEEMIQIISDVGNERRRS